MPLQDLLDVRVTRTIQEDGTTTTIRTTNWQQRGQAHAGQDYQWTGQSIFFLRDHEEMDPSFSRQSRSMQTELDQENDDVLVGEETESESEEPAETLAVLVHGTGFGVLDTGCGRGLVGEETLQRHETELRRHGLEITELEDVPHTFRYGNGSADKSIKRVQLPVFIKGRRMSMRVHVVPGGVPLLISKRFLKALGPQIDLQNNTIVFKQAHVTTELHEKKDGSYQLNLIDLCAPPSSSSHEVDVLEAMEEGGSDGEKDVFTGDFTINPEYNTGEVDQIENDQEAESLEETPSDGVDRNGCSSNETEDNDGENANTLDDAGSNETSDGIMESESDWKEDDAVSLMVFKSEERKKVQNNLVEVLRTKEDEAPTVIEVFCPGRFAEMTESCGLRSQGSFDLSDGWDWTIKEHRDRVEMTIDMGDPDLVIMSPHVGRCHECRPALRWRSRRTRSSSVGRSSRQKPWWHGAASWLGNNEIVASIFFLNTLRQVKPGNIHVSVNCKNDAMDAGLMSQHVQ